MLWFSVLACIEPSVPPPLTVFLVRHAEKAGKTGDVPLTAAGLKRADVLSGILVDVDLTGIHSTDTNRTRATVAPTAAQHGLKTEIYAHDDAGFVGRLTHLGGTHLVAGHSNTVPGLVEALGGIPGVPIAELEFDRLYIVTRPSTGPSASSRLRYGASH